ncbi:MAG: DUF1697 domain-containing protein [Candidatus Sericytochromatia bacterium]|nr:DUF1697 domain-containing protein [Candidatus Sericytochromatia bacterium]
MQTYTALLRGINVSGHNKIKMSDLSLLFESLDFKGIKTYIQSGNVIFQGENLNHQELEKKISDKIFEVFSFKVSIIIKTVEQLKNIIQNNPFIKDKNEDINNLYLTFLSDKPDNDHLDRIKSLNYGSDEFIVSDQVIYLFCSNGYGKTKLTNNFFESKLKLIATTRNWKTINTLISIIDL